MIGLAELDRAFAARQARRVGLRWRELPPVAQHPVQDDGIFTRQYARSYDRSMADAHPHLRRVWRFGVELQARQMTDVQGVILDAGTGTGRVAAEILKWNPSVRVIGLDRSVGFLEVAQERLGQLAAVKDRVLLWQDDLGQPLPFASGIFGGATSHWVIQYLSRSKQLQLCRELARVLEPGARFAVNISCAPFSTFVPIFYKAALKSFSLAEIVGLARISRHLSVVRKFNEGYRTGKMYLPHVPELLRMLREGGFRAADVIDTAKMPLTGEDFVSYVLAIK